MIELTNTTIPPKKIEVLANSKKKQTYHHNSQLPQLL
jgi:hypothetical protein